jgi:hypothetical protein
MAEVIAVVGARAGAMVVGVFHHRIQVRRVPRSPSGYWQIAMVFSRADILCAAYGY